MDISSWICHNFYLHHHLTEQLGKEHARAGTLWYTHEQAQRYKINWTTACSNTDSDATKQQQQKQRQRSDDNYCCRAPGCLERGKAEYQRRAWPAARWRRALDPQKVSSKLVVAQRFAGREVRWKEKMRQTVGPDRRAQHHYSTTTDQRTESHSRFSVTKLQTRNSDWKVW